MLFNNHHEPQLLILSSRDLINLIFCCCYLQKKKRCIDTFKFGDLLDIKPSMATKRLGRHVQLPELLEKRLLPTVSSREAARIRKKREFSDDIDDPLQIQVEIFYKKICP